MHVTCYYVSMIQKCSLFRAFVPTAPPPTYVAWIVSIDPSGLT